MAYMYPETNHADNRGEKSMYENFKSFLPSGFVCYHNRSIATLEFDFLLLVPGRGIIVCETKGHEAHDIKSVQSTGYTLTDGSFIHSPYDQALKYSRLLAAKLKSDFERDIPVVPVVCYPFINEADFTRLGLYSLSSWELTLLSEDTTLTLTKRIIAILDEARQQRKKQFAELTLNMMFKVRSLFEPAEAIQNSSQVVEYKPQARRREHYSCLAILPKEEATIQGEALFRELISIWRSGTKLCVVTDGAEFADMLRLRMDNFVRELDAGSYDRFTLFDGAGLAKSATFNFELYCLEEIGASIEYAFDGELSEEQKSILHRLDGQTSFNLSQYCLEHGEVDRNIMVVAGAGTGKTTSMISRISYLVYRHSLTADTLPDTLFMLTFTNEAARNMKRKLKDYFQDYFLLTMDYEALRLSECVEGMRIGTIHALSKRILEHYSVSLGLGKSLQIISGKYEKDRFLLETLNDYISGSQQDCNAIGLPMYEIHNRLSDVLEKLHNKNIDILKDHVDWGTVEGDQTLHNILTNVLFETERKTRQHFDSISAIRLSDLIIKMKELVREHSDDLRAEAIPVRYVFIDEFQDTDDVQIDLVRKFREVYGFSLFVVGDTKQCIYRFRGANDKAFDYLVQSAERAEWLTFELSKNYRSDKKLLQAFDARFTHWEQNDLLEYREADRLIGVLELNSDENENAYYYPETRWSNDDTKVTRLLEILKRLMQDPLIAQGEQVAILVRENWQVEAVKDACARNGIGVETDVGGVLYKLQPAIDLYKLVKALQHHRDPKHLFNLYTTYYIGAPMPKDLLFAARYAGNGEVEQRGIFNVKYKPIPNWDRYVDKIKFEPVLKVLREIVLAVKPWMAYGKRELTEEEQLRASNFYRHNLDALFEKLAFGFNSDYLTVSRVERFLEIMIQTGQKEQSREPLVSEQKTSIVCMTVHKSKGLEFHTVILPYMSRIIGAKNHKGNTDIIVLDNKIGYSIKVGGGYHSTLTNDYYQQFKAEEAEDRKAEEARILYVAMTRAKRRLVYFDDRKNAGTLAAPQNWLALLRGEGAR